MQRHSGWKGLDSNQRDLNLSDVWFTDKWTLTRKFQRKFTSGTTEKVDYGTKLYLCACLLTLRRGSELQDCSYKCQEGSQTPSRGLKVCIGWYGPKGPLFLLSPSGWCKGQDHQWPWGVLDIKMPLAVHHRATESEDLIAWLGSSGFCQPELTWKNKWMPLWNGQSNVIRSGPCGHLDIGKCI